VGWINEKGQDFFPLLERGEDKKEDSVNEILTSFIVLPQTVDWNWDG